MGVNLMSGQVRCDWCGNYIKTRDTTLSSGLGLNWVTNGIANAKKHYCSRACKLAAEEANQKNKGSNESSGGSFGGHAAKAYDGPSVEEIQAKAAERQQAEAVKSNIQNKIVMIKTFQLSTDPAEYKKQMIEFVGEYKYLKPSSDAEDTEIKLSKDLKKAYKARLIKEFDKLKLSDPEMYQAIYPEFESILKMEKIKLLAILIGSVIGIVAFVIFILVNM